MIPALENHRFLTLEMSYTPQEFATTLQGAFSTRTSARVQAIDTHHWQVHFKHHQISIRISEQPSRRIAMLTLPVLKVQFDFEEASEQEAHAFLKLFFKYFHKGGG